MKKTFKKTGALLLAGMLCAGSVSALTSCSVGTKATNSTNEIEILYWNSGMGIDFLNQMKAEFESQYPEYTIYINPVTAVNEATGGNIINGAATGDTIDLYLGTGAAFVEVREALVSIDELLETEIPGENGAKLKDKVYGGDYLNGGTYGGKTYALPWINAPMSIVYNKSVFDEMGYKVPRTTEELYQLATMIVADGQSTGITYQGKKLTAPNSTDAPSPFIHSKKGYEYWTSMQDTWLAQYEGLDNYEKITRAKYYDPTNQTEYFPSINALNSRGKLEVIKAMEKVIGATGHTYYASNAYTHTESQTYFLNTAALMMPNGAWLENEMKQHVTPYEFAMMKLPVLSAVGEKLGISEKQLQEAVSYVDSEDYASGTTVTGKEYNKTVVDEILAKTNGQEIIDAVAEARSILYNGGGSQRALIPAYSTGIEGAKKFLLYFYSDKGMATYMNGTHTPAYGNFTDPAKIPDMSTWSSFTRSCVELGATSRPIVSVRNDDFFVRNSKIVNMWYTHVPSALTNVNAGDRKTAKEIFAADIKYHQTQLPLVCEILSIKNYDNDYRAVAAELYQ